MEKTYLFPSSCKKAGLGMFVPFAVAGVCMLGGWWNLEWSLPVYALLFHYRLYRSRRSAGYEE